MHCILEWKEQEDGRSPSLIDIPCKFYERSGDCREVFGQGRKRNGPIFTLFRVLLKDLLRSLLPRPVRYRIVC